MARPAGRTSDGVWEDSLSGLQGAGTDDDVQVGDRGRIRDATDVRDGLDVVCAASGAGSSTWEVRTPRVFSFHTSSADTVEQFFNQYDASHNTAPNRLHNRAIRDRIVMHEATVEQQGGTAMGAGTVLTIYGGYFTGWVSRASDTQDIASLATKYTFDLGDTEVSDTAWGLSLNPGGANPPAVCYVSVYATEKVTL